MIDRLRDAYRRWRVRRRRSKLQRAYAKVGEIRHDLGPGFTPTLFAYGQLTNEGLASLVETEDGAELDWYWPEDELDTESRECPDCGEAAPVVVDVQSVGTGNFDAIAGEVHVERNGGYGEGWRLYCHETFEETDSA
ncbi:hypothetical protein HZS55_08990 [Halosimplex rubrum]|uniref:Uncharacterized protein n=1 Tax=Halosimplex rubrum TaxID=869889 RepID=A0A7D5P4R7_9EURY|nr:hypothetical protein [Halosimplex rubrum]QLH77422.1 hypothetical protein HZS55_08990 [Halosimplex rubrum]